VHGKSDADIIFLLLSDIMIWKRETLVVILHSKKIKVLVMKKKRGHDGVTDAVKAMRKGNREAEMELLGPGFHSRHSIHKSANIYTRKEKHKSKISNDSPCASLFVLRKRNVK